MVERGKTRAGRRGGGGEVGRESGTLEGGGRLSWGRDPCSLSHACSSSSSLQAQQYPYITLYKINQARMTLASFSLLRVLTPVRRFDFLGDRSPPTADILGNLFTPSSC